MEAPNFSLEQLQTWMQGMLVHHVPVVEGVDNTSPIHIDDVICASEKLSAVSHLDIYRYSYIDRLRSCMQSQFSTLSYALGKELFEMFADQYLDVYPSESYTLNTLGEKFPAFLEETRPDADQEEKESWPDFMIELAQFEYDLSLIFDQQKHDENIDPDFDTADASLKLRPVFHLFHHQFPICNYYLEHIQGKEPELPFPQVSYCVVIRRNYKLGLFNIKPAQHYFLGCLQSGNDIEIAKQQLVNKFNFNRADFDNIWPEWKRYFIDSGFFVACK